MAHKRLSVKTQFISFLSLALLIFTLFSLINLANTKTKLNLKASSYKDFGFAAKLKNSVENLENQESSYISIDGNLFAPQKGYTIEIWFKPTQPEFPKKYIFSFNQNDSPLMLNATSYKKQNGLYDISFEAGVGENSNGTCIQSSQSNLLEDLNENEITNWWHAAITVNERGEWNYFINGQKINGNSQIGNLCQPDSDFLIGTGSENTTSSFPVEVDELRVSNKVRYTDSFEPSLYPFEEDHYTLVLLNFNENLTSSVNQELGGEIVGNVSFVNNLLQ